MKKEYSERFVELAETGIPFSGKECGEQYYKFYLVPGKGNVELIYSAWNSDDFPGKLTLYGFYDIENKKPYFLEDTEDVSENNTIGRNEFVNRIFSILKGKADSIEVSGEYTGDVARGGDNWRKMLRPTKWTVQEALEFELSPGSLFAILTGEMSVSEYAENLFQKREETIRVRKENAAVQTAYERRYDLDDYAHLYRVVDGGWYKTVNVTFEFNGVTVTEKMEAEELCRKVLLWDDISSYSFPTRDKGKAVAEKLGLSWNNRMYPDSITKVTYGRNTIWRRDV